MHSKWLLLMLSMVVVLAVSGCLGGDAAAPAERATEDLLDEEESLFTIYTTPPDWPRAIPAIMNEYKVTRYERTENTMHASGIADLGIFRANNYYNNAVSGSSYSWDFDPAKESVTEGPEQIFYLIDAEGRTLVVTLKEINSDKIEFVLDFTDSD
jgi:hypothetical protein